MRKNLIKTKFPGIYYEQVVDILMIQFQLTHLSLIKNEQNLQIVNQSKKEN